MILFENHKAILLLQSGDSVNDNMVPILNIVLQTRSRNRKSCYYYVYSFVSIEFVEREKSAAVECASIVCLSRWFFYVHGSVDCFCSSTLQSRKRPA